MKAIFGAGLALAIVLAACAPPRQEAGSPPEAPPPAPNGCAAEAVRDWAAGDATFKVAIGTSGATCADAEAALTVTDAAGVVIHRETLRAAETFGLRDAADPTAMKVALQGALDAGADMNDTATLPAWPADAEAPGGEFPFYVESLDRAAYEALRKAKTPMLCYIQGGESLGCWRRDGSSLIKIGAQSFPG